ncbi:MAG: DUF1501 domain-containing protein [Pseudomonadota bacterium]
MISRRQILKSIGMTAAASSLPGLAFANAGTDARFVLVVLRGAVDGLALAPPYGDGNYTRVRGELALSSPGSSNGAHKLDGLFGLHPSLPTVGKLYDSGAATIVHAVASPYRARSHFDGQDLLENGATRVGALRDGWLNRALLPLGGSVGDEQAIALAQNTPLVLRGDNSVTSWAPSQLPDADDSTIARLQRLYADDEFFSVRLEQALRSQDIAGSDMASRGGRGNEARQFAELMTSAAKFLTTANGPRVAVVELGGWDTHANQGAENGALANRFAALDTGLANLKTGLGDRWADTAVLVVTEFGRTVRVNGTRGTDHGTATAAMLLGGAVNGGNVVADWPGLRDSNLYAGRDLMPTTDLRSVFKGVLAEHLDLDPAYLNSRVFPDSGDAPPMRDLIRT